MSPELHNISNKFKVFLSRYHYTAFLVISVCGIAIGIYSLVIVVQNSSAIHSTQMSDSNAIDQATIERIRNVQDRSAADLKLPTDQRINLFAE